MNNKQHSVNDGFLVIYRICFAIALIAVLAFVLSSCTSSKKNKAVFKEKTDSTYIHELESRLRVLTIVNEKLQSKVDELEYMGVVFETDTSCNEELREALTRAGVNADSLMSTMNTLKNRVRFFADGSFEAEGRLKNVTRLKTRLEETISELKKENDSLLQVKQKEKVVVETRTIFKEKSVKSKSWTFIFLTLGLISGCWFWNKFGDRIKKFFRSIF